MENTEADARRDGWTRLARPNYHARTGSGEIHFPLFSWPRAGLATLSGWSILCSMWWPYIHTYIHWWWSSNEECSYFLSFRMVFFYLVTTGWIFETSLCGNLINQSINHKPWLATDCNNVWRRGYIKIGVLVVLATAVVQTQHKRRVL